MVGKLTNDKAKPVEYHDPESCNKCGLMSNRYLRGAFHEGEIETKCTACGHHDYWAYGFFESGSYMVSQCSTYSFRRE
jgi:hypothetical protein